MLILNKIDETDRPRLLTLAATLNAGFAFSDTFMISAKTGDGLDDLRTEFAGRVRAGPWLYPEDQLSDLPTRLLAAEITREQLYLQLGQELPYSSTVEHEKWEEREAAWTEGHRHWQERRQNQVDRRSRAQGTDPSSRSPGSPEAACESSRGMVGGFRALSRDRTGLAGLGGQLNRALGFDTEQEHQLL
jgi:hypothetical protein